MLNHRGIFEESVTSEATTPEELFALNDRHADNVVCFGAVLSIFIWIGLELCDKAGFMGFVEKFGLHVSVIYIAIFALVVLVYFLGKRAWSGYRVFALLLYALAFASMNVLFQGYAFTSLCFPILLAGLYYSRRFTILIGSAVLVLAMASYGVIYVLQGSETFVSYQYTYLGYLPYTRLSEMIFGTCLPSALMVGLVVVLSWAIAAHGRAMVYKQAEISVRAARTEGELEAAAALQQHIMPDNFDVAATDGIELHACVRSAKETAGDFYDFFTSGDHTLNIVVADVSDKGLRSAMFMMLVRNTFRALLTKDAPLEQIAGFANSILTSENNEGMFVTALIMRMDTLTGHVEYVNAGHAAPLVRDAQGVIRSVDDGTIEPDPFMGMFDDATYAKRTFIVQPGDMLLGFTDGITDAESTQREFFGSERLVQAMSAAAPDADPEAFCLTVLNCVDRFTAGANRFDDITLLALRFNPAEALWLPAVQESIEPAVNWVNEALSGVGCPQDDRRLIDVVLDDALVNIVNYAYTQGEDAGVGVAAGEAAGVAASEAAGEVSSEAVAADEGSSERADACRAAVSAGDQGMLLRCHAQAGSVSLAFLDRGVAFDPTIAEVPEREYGGLGISFIMNIMDEVSYERRGGFNVLKLEKRW